MLGGLCSGANVSLQGALADSRVCGALLINLFLVTWSGAVINERIRRAGLSDGLLTADVPGLDSSAVRRQVSEAIAAFDRLRERDTESSCYSGTRRRSLKSSSVTGYATNSIAGRTCGLSGSLRVIRCSGNNGCSDTCTNA